MALNLDKRERSALALGGLALFLVLMLAVYVPSGPQKAYAEAKAEVGRLNRELAMKKEAIAEEEERLHDQEQLARRLQQRDPRFDLYSYLEGLVRQNDLTARAQLRSLDRMRDRTASENQMQVQLDLNNISLKELVDFLYEVYASKNLIAVREVRVSPSPDNKGLNCELRFATISHA